MFGVPLGQVIEILVGILLVLTIAYCAILNERLKKLRADESALKSMVGELINATKMAERAIATLKGTVSEAERSIGDRLDEADRLSSELTRLVDEGRRVAQRISTAAPSPHRQPSAPAAPVRSNAATSDGLSTSPRASQARPAFSILGLAEEP